MKRINSDNCEANFEYDPVPPNPTMKKKFIGERIREHLKDPCKGKNKLESLNNSLLNSQKLKSALNYSNIKKSKNSNIILSVNNQEPVKPFIPLNGTTGQLIEENQENLQDKIIIDNNEKIEDEQLPEEYKEENKNNENLN